AFLTRRTLMAAVPSSFLPTPGLSTAFRPLIWAQPVELAGVPNLHQITPNLYRSSQPTAAGFRNLEALGIKTIISFRQTVSDGPLAPDSKLTLQRIPMKTRHVAEKSGAKIVTVMQSLNTALIHGPTLIHCHHGADRTGLITALYRMLYQSWTREAALKELIEGGHGFHAMWANIPRYLLGVDLAALKSRIAA
ncbi:MAG: tyrosine-protein phosphatase, partial [Paracoccaceae bacterium]